MNQLEMMFRNNPLFARAKQMAQGKSENATLISTLRPTPIPAYQTCSPYESVYMYSRCGNGYNNCCGG